MTTPSPADGGAAFPIPNERDQWGDGISEGSRGMSLRDWFAGQIAPAVVARILVSTTALMDDVPGNAATLAYAIADGMLAERAK